MATKEKKLETCAWSLTDPLMLEYHNKEWGVPVHDDRKLFEFIVLEGFQAGLSWMTILRKRENFRKAFDNFDYNKIAKYDQKKLNALMLDAGIIRNKLKIESTVTNAQAFLKVRTEFKTFDKYIWSFVNGKPIVTRLKSQKDIQPKTALSDKISAELKERGFKFVGSTIVYAHMQATGMVNDHVVDCPRFKALNHGM